MQSEILMERRILQKLLNTNEKGINIMMKLFIIFLERYNIDLIDTIFQLDDEVQIESVIRYIMYHVIDQINAKYNINLDYAGIHVDQYKIIVSVEDLCLKEYKLDEEEIKWILKELHIWENL